MISSVHTSLQYPGFEDLNSSSVVTIGKFEVMVSGSSIRCYAGNVVFVRMQYKIVYELYIHDGRLRMVSNVFVLHVVASSVIKALDNFLCDSIILVKVGIA